MRRRRRVASRRQCGSRRALVRQQAGATRGKLFRAVIIFSITALQNISQQLDGGF